MRRQRQDCGPDRSHDRAQERGSVAISVAALGALTLVGIVVMAVAAISAARQRAVRAADLAALAAAAKVLSEPEAACSAARDVSRANGALTVSCRMDQLLLNGIPTVRVDVEAPPVPFVAEALGLIGVPAPPIRAAARGGLTGGHG